MTNAEQSELEYLLQSASSAAETAWEIDFVDDMQERYDRYGADTYVSSKQWDRLRAIAYGER